MSEEKQPKVAVIYYSLEGNTKLLAQNIARTMNADLIEIKLAKSTWKYRGPWKYFFGGYHAIYNKDIEIADVDQNLEDYDLIVLGTPVWAGRITPQVRSFLKKYPISNKKVALFCSYGGGLGKTFEIMRELLEGNDILGEEDFQALNKKQETLVVLKAQSWAKFLLGKL